jgi:hypothetical protein
MSLFRALSAARLSGDSAIAIRARPGHTDAMKLLPVALLCGVATAVFAQSAALPPLPPDGFVTLEQIVSDFASQPQVAADKYNGQQIVVYGRVGPVAQSDDEAGDPLVVFLQLANTPTPDVKCVFPLADLPEWSDTAGVQISEDGSQAVLFHRGKDGNVMKQHVFATTGQTLGICGTFDRLVAGDIVLKDCEKVGAEKLTKILQAHGIATE